MREDNSPSIFQIPLGAVKGRKKKGKPGILPLERGIPLVMSTRVELYKTGEEASDTIVRDVNLIKGGAVRHI